MMWTVLCMTLCATGVLSQPDTTPCESNGAYNTSDGTATCGGFHVSVKGLVCGDDFSQASCVAKWMNTAGENQWYFFMGAGLGMSASMLPAPCSSLPSGLAMVQYNPDSHTCYPAADLPGLAANLAEVIEWGRMRDYLRRSFLVTAARAVSDVLRRVGGCVV